MRRTAQIPRSRAKTAYGLLGEIGTLILAEPKRYDQQAVLAIGEDARFLYETVPACGTVGCVAGWTVALTFKRPGAVRDPLFSAQRTLGLSTEQADELFAGGAADGDPQTYNHAQSGVEHIRTFQKKYRAQLLATKV